MKSRGAAMLYAVILSLVSVSLVGGLVHIIGLANADQSRQEKYVRARALADLQLSVLKSGGKNDLLTLPLNFSRPVGGMNTAGTAVEQAQSGLVQVEQTVRVAGTEFFFRDFVALRSLSKVFYWASWGAGADNFLSGWSGAANVTASPDWAGANLIGSPSGSNTLGIAGFSASTELEGDNFSDLLGALSLTAEQFEAYDFIAFMTSSSANSNWTNTVWEFHKWNLRIRVNANGAGVIQRNITPATFQSVFGLEASPLGGSGTVRAILFDFDQISGNATFTNSADQLRAIVQSPGSGTAPVIDAAARLGSEEDGTLMGMMHESGLVHRLNQINAFSSVLVRTVLSAPDNAGSNALFTPLGAGNINYAIYEGTLIPPATGNYRFRVRTDDGSRLWVNDVNRISTWVAQAPTTHTSGQFSLTANVPVPIWYEWWEGGGQEARQLQWQIPGSNTYVTIPDQNLRPGNGTEPVGRGFWGFNDGVSTGWTLTGIRTAGDGNGSLGMPNASGIVQNQYLGDFGGANAEPSVSLGEVPAGRIIVTYEVQILGTWETNNGNGNGNGNSQTGPDQLILRANGGNVFSHNAGQTTTGELSTTLPFASVLRDGNWRRYRGEFEHAGGNLTLSWQKSSPNPIDPITNESFVIDNVMVRRKR